MTPKRVVVSDYNFGDLDVESAIIAGAGCEVEPYQCTDSTQVVAALQGADVALIQMAPVEEEAIGGMADNATLVRYGAGIDNIDLDACRRHGVALANVPDYGTEEVAVHAMTLLLSLIRRIGDLDASVRSGRWESVSILGETSSVRDFTLGLFGVGKIGLEMASYANGFSMTVIGHDPFADKSLCSQHGVELVSVDGLWERSDAISFHAPLTDETHHALNEKSLAKMKGNAVVVNCARGGLIDGDALAKALRDGRIAGAGLDVFGTEPLPADHQLRSAPNLIMTPHAAWCSARSMRRLRELTAEEAVRAIQGEPLRCPVPLD